MIVAFVFANGKIYHYIKLAKNWNDAQQFCKAQGGRLPIFDTSSELSSFFDAYHREINDSKFDQNQIQL